MNKVIDSHHHLWNFSEAEYGWIDRDMIVLRQDFSPGMLRSELAASGIDGCVAVQARQSLEETDWLLTLANKSPFIKGVVGWLPLQSDSLEEEIASRLENRTGRRLVGVRHVVQDESDPRFILGKDFNRGVKLLENYGLVYDILVTEGQLPEVIEFVDRHPHQVFVLDHLAKPRIAAAVLEPWGKNMTELACRENLYCKISGMVTEADWKSWTLENLKPYLDKAFEVFGAGRLMFGSDWPVCLLASTYDEWYQTLAEYCSRLSSDEQEAVFSGNAEKIYRLDLP